MTKYKLCRSPVFPQWRIEENGEVIATYNSRDKARDELRKLKASESLSKRDLPGVYQGGGRGFREMTPRDQEPGPEAA